MTVRSMWNRVDWALGYLDIWSSIVLGVCESVSGCD